MSARPSFEPPDEVMILDWVEIARLRIPSYQRPERKDVSKMVAEWETRACGALIVSERDNTLWTVDGQTRCKAARQLGITHLPAVIQFGLDEAGEARLFLRENRDRLAVNAIARHIVEAVAGERRAVAIDEVLLAHSMHVKNSSGPGTRHPQGLAPFQAVGAAERCYDWGGPELLDRTLTLIDLCFPREYGRFRGQIVAGLGYFLARDEWGAEDTKIVKALSPVTTSNLDERARHAQALSGMRAAIGAGGSPVHMARGIASLVYRDRGLEWKPKRR